jgi:hypothetical protein
VRKKIWNTGISDFSKKIEYCLFSALEITRALESSKGLNNDSFCTAHIILVSGFMLAHPLPFKVNDNNSLSVRQALSSAKIYRLDRFCYFNKYLWLSPVNFYLSVLYRYWK